MEMKNKTILIVDDELDICVTLSKILNSNGYKTITATNSSSGLKPYLYPISSSTGLR